MLTIHNGIRLSGMIIQDFFDEARRAGVATSLFHPRPGATADAGATGEE